VGEGPPGLEAEHWSDFINFLISFEVPFRHVSSGVAVAVLGVCLISTFNISRSLEVNCPLSLSISSTYGLTFVLQHRPNPPMRWIPSMLWSKQKVCRFNLTPRPPDYPFLLPSLYNFTQRPIFFIAAGSRCCWQWFSFTSGCRTSLIGLVYTVQSLPDTQSFFTSSSFHCCIPSFFRISKLLGSLSIFCALSRVRFSSSRWPANKDVPNLTFDLVQ
jgi:hypothetical protein